MDKIITEPVAHFYDDDGTYRWRLDTADIPGYWQLCYDELEDGRWVEKERFASFLGEAHFRAFLEFVSANPDV